MSELKIIDLNFILFFLSILFLFLFLFILGLRLEFNVTWCHNISHSHTTLSQVIVT